MFEGLSFPDFRLVWDVLDILIVALGIYYLLTVIEKTRTIRILIGFIFVFLLYLLSQYGELYTLNWALGHFLNSIIIIAVILFQQDIRRALAGFGRRPLIFTGGAKQMEERLIFELVKACSYMSNKMIGAIIAIERGNSLADFVEIGMRIEALVSRELIISIFNPASPLHDGGMIIARNRILSVGSFFPLATDPDLERDLGTRHRAAIGLSRETDAIVIVVSEETGLISLAYQGNLMRGLDATSLENRLMELLSLKQPQSHGYGLLTRMFNIRNQAGDSPQRLTGGE